MRRCRSLGVLARLSGPWLTCPGHFAPNQMGQYEPPDWITLYAVDLRRSPLLLRCCPLFLTSQLPAAGMSMIDSQPDVSMDLIGIYLRCGPNRQGSANLLPSVSRPRKPRGEEGRWKSAVPVNQGRAEMRSKAAAHAAPGSRSREISANCTSKAPPRHTTVFIPPYNPPAIKLICSPFRVDSTAPAPTTLLFIARCDHAAAPVIAGWACTIVSTSRIQWLTFGARLPCRPMPSVPG